MAETDIVEAEVVDEPGTDLEAAPLPSNLCACGCGEKPRHATSRFVRGHNRGPTRKGPDWREEDRGYKTPCWIWQHTRSSNGYGTVWNGTRNVGAHRWTYELKVGPIPRGLTLDHLCRVHECVNPDHLEPVTAAVNSRRGLNTKLTLAAVAEIRASNESYDVLAARFGVHRDHIKNIRGGRAWKS